MSSYLHPTGVQSEHLGCARVHANASSEAPSQRPLLSTDAVASCECRGRRDGKIKAPTAVDRSLRRAGATSIVGKDFLPAIAPKSAEIYDEAWLLEIEAVAMA